MDGDISFLEVLKTLKKKIEAKKTLGALGMNYEKIHAFPNDCCLYRK